MSLLSIYSFIILIHSTCSMMMPGGSQNEDPCHVCEKISEKFVEVDFYLEIKKTSFNIYSNF